MGGLLFSCISLYAQYIGKDDTNKIASIFLEIYFFFSYYVCKEWNIHMLSVVGTFKGSSAHF